MARITVTTGQGAFAIRVEDDGVGGADISAGTGLLGLRDRVEAAGGTFTIGGGVGGRGVSLEAEFPSS